MIWLRMGLLLKNYPNAIRFIAIILLASVAGLGVAVALHFYGAAQYEKGAAAIQQKWDAAKLAQQIAYAQALKQRTDENAALRDRYEKALADMRGKYASEKALVDQYHAAHLGDGLRLPDSVCAAAGFARPPEAGRASGGAAATAGTVVLPEEIERNLRELLREADQAAAVGRIGQGFIKQNGFAP